MKKMYNKTLFAFMALALSFTACSKDADLEEAVLPGEDLVELTFTAAGDDDTRTYVEETGEADRPYRIRWAESGEELLVVCFNGWMYPTSKATISSYDSENNTATFSGSVDASAQSFYGIYPYSAVPSPSGIWSEIITVKVPDAQTPTATSYDPAADLLITQKASSAVNGDVAFSFTRIVALANMKLKGIQAGETIEKIEFTGSKIAGTFQANASNGNTDFSRSTLTDKITLDMSNYTAAVTGEEEVVPVWFTAIPATLTSMTVKVTTTDGTKQYAYEKTVDLGAGQQLKEARVARFGVAFSAENRTELGGTPGVKKVFKKLTDASQLQNGTEIVFLSSDNKLMGSGYDQESVSYSWGYKPTENVTVTNDMIEDVADARIFTLETTDNIQFALKFEGSKYLATSYGWGAYSSLSTEYTATYWTLDNLSFKSSLSLYIHYYNGYFLSSNSSNVTIYYATEVAGGGTDDSFHLFDGTATLEAGDEVVFLSNNNKLMGFGYEYNTNASGYIFKPTEIVQPDNGTIAAQTIQDVSAQIFTLETSDGSNFALKNQKNQYLALNTTGYNPAIKALAVQDATANWVLDGTSFKYNFSEYYSYYPYYYTDYGFTTYSSNQNNVSLYYRKSGGSQGGGTPVVSEPNATFDLVADIDKYYSHSSNDDSKGNITFSGGSWRKNASGYDDWSGLFFGTGKTLTIKPASGSNVTITKIVATAREGYYVNMTYPEGVYPDETIKPFGGATATTATWEGSCNYSSGITFTNVGNPNSYITKIEVWYE